MQIRQDKCAAYIKIYDICYFVVKNSVPVKYKCSIFIRNVKLRSHSMLVRLANFLGKPLYTQITNL